MIDIIFNEINANTLSTNGVVFNGQNALYGWSGHVKQNALISATGVGNPVVNDLGILSDRDKMDSAFFNADQISAESAVGKIHGGKKTLRINGKSIDSN